MVDSFKAILVRFDDDDGRTEALDERQRRKTNKEAQPSRNDARDKAECLENLKGLRELMYLQLTTISTERNTQQQIVVAVILEDEMGIFKIVADTAMSLCSNDSSAK
jgi:hypothetical protein